MSADKKVPGERQGRQGDDGLRQERGAATKAQKSGQADKNIATDGQTRQASQRPRARNQDVLPEILGKQLRAAYGELLSAPVPDTFTSLIERLKSQEPDAPRPAKSGEPPSEEDGQ